ncbi:MAG: XdhC family protein [Rhodanobacteraceae bacterium]
MAARVQEQARIASGGPMSPPPGGRRALARAAEEIAREGRGAALAVVVATRGSTYRKPGALVLLDAGGVCVGALSGGCLEAELEEHAREVIEAACAKRVQFDTRDDGDRVFGSGSGCRGLMDVLVLPLPASGAPLRDALIDSAQCASSMSIELATDAEWIGCGEVRVAARSWRFDAGGRAFTGTWPVAASVLLNVAPEPRLLLLGAGPETPFLLAMIAVLGWHAEIVERRERWRGYARDIGPEPAHAAGLDGLAGLLDTQPFDAALVMNHNFDLDARCLRELAPATIDYVGLLGPRERRDALLGELGEALAEQLKPRLHAPVGLDLGGEGPEAIALAIIAELHKHLAGLANA